MTTTEEPDSGLVVERRDQANLTTAVDTPAGVVALSPPVDEGYWSYRVQLGASGIQSVVGFPKYNGFGIGFAVEEDWNTNLPWQAPTDRILEHIWHNLGVEGVSRQNVRDAIWLIQHAIATDLGKDLDEALEQFEAKLHPKEI